MTFYEFFQSFKDGKPFIVDTAGPGTCGIYMMRVLRMDEKGGQILWGPVNSDNNEEEYNVSTISWVELQLTTTWTIVDYFEFNLVKCECGAESIGIDSHSHWCNRARAA